MFHISLMFNVPKSQSHTYIPSSLSLSTAGSDYVPLMEMVTFEPGVTRVCVDIPIINDTTLEPPETFSVEIPPSDDVDPGPPAIVTIIDDGQWEAPV